VLTRLGGTDRPFAPFPIAVAHASEADARHSDSSIAKLRVLRGCSSLDSGTHDRFPRVENIPREFQRQTCAHRAACQAHDKEEWQVGIGCRGAITYDFVLGPAAENAAAVSVG
jgi:hypothetical protein